MVEEKETSEKPRIRKNTTILLILIVVTILCNILARIWKGYANWHISYIQPLWVNTYGRFTSLLPFSLGEWMIVLGVILTAVFTISIICLIFQKIRVYSKKYIRIYLNIVVIVAFVMTNTCFIAYQGSTFAEKYGIDQSCVTKENLIIMRNYLVKKVNEMSATFERDENGDILYEGDFIKQSKEEMKRLGNTYPQLKGYYVTPKYIYHSAFLSQQYILGYYFPFSMEANLNAYQYPCNLPVTICHELAHTKGFLLEDEANYIGFLACVDSKDPYFEYAAYLSVLYYVDEAFKQTIHYDMEAYADSEAVLDRVWMDSIFLTPEAWEEVNKKSFFSTDTVEKATDVFLNTNLKVNGVEDGVVSYSRVVQLLLTYYDGKLWG